MAPLSTELSFKVVQVQGPHEGPAKLLLLHVADLSNGEDNDTFDYDLTILIEFDCVIKCDVSYVEYTYVIWFYVL